MQGLALTPLRDTPTPKSKSQPTPESEYDCYSICFANVEVPLQPIVHPRRPQRMVPNRVRATRRRPQTRLQTKSPLPERPKAPPNPRMARVQPPKLNVSLHYPCIERAATANGSSGADLPKSMSVESAKSDASEPSPSPSKEPSTPGAG